MDLKKLSLVICICSCALFVNAQDTLTIRLNKHQNTSGRTSITPLYAYSGNPIYYRNTPLDITLPANLNWSDTSFGFIYFTGNTDSKINRECLFLVGNINEEQSEILVDRNCNLDLTDDEKPTRFRDSVIVAIPNKDNPEAEMHFMFYRNTFSDEINQRNRDYYSSKSTAHNNKILPVGQWLHDARLNSRIADTTINGERFFLGVHDQNVDGLFNKDGDVILSGVASTGFISNHLSQGAEKLGDTTLIKQNGKVYRITEVDELGHFLRLAKSDLPFNKLVTGDKIPDFELTDMNDEVVNLHEIMDSEKYTLIDVWGKWCAPCIKQFPHLVELHEKHSKNLNIIGLNYGDLPEDAKSFIAEKDVPWENLFLSAEMHQALSVDAYPFYVLIAPGDEIVKFFLPLKEVEEILNKI